MGRARVYVSTGVLSDMPRRRFSSRRRVALRGSSRRRGAKVSRPSGPVGTVRRYAARTVRELPLYAPVRKMPRPEMKYHDVTGASYAADTTGTLTYLSQIPQGDGVVQRVGQRVMILSVLARGRALANASTTLTTL